MMAKTKVFLGAFGIDLPLDQLLNQALVSLSQHVREALDIARRWQQDPLVMDKWFAIQAATPGVGTVARVEALMRHPAFTMRNPNKVRAVLGVFAMSNPTAFHAADGSGYRLLADRVLELDALNPQVAARIVGAFNPWLRHEPTRRALMKAQLQRIAAAPGLSGDVSEIVESALGMEGLEAG